MRSPKSLQRAKIIRTAGVVGDPARTSTGGCGSIRAPGRSLLRRRLRRICNERTARALALAEIRTGRPIVEVADFEAFLDATDPMLTCGRVLIAIGDSRTTNFNYARSLQQRHFADGGLCVINLGDWASPHEDHVRPLEFYLDHVRHLATAEITVVAFGWLFDMQHLLSLYEDYRRGAKATPLTEAETALTRHRHGAELAALTSALPVSEDPTEAAQWFAQRAGALAALLQQTCADYDAYFRAIIEPSSYADLSPSYIQALRDAHTTAAVEIDFAAWCNERSYCSDPSAYLGQDGRALLDYLRKQWYMLQTQFNPSIQRLVGFVPRCSGLLL